MHPIRKERLIVVCLIVALSSGAIGFTTFALRDNINLFYPPSDINSGRAPINRNIRVGGMVVEGSIERSEKDLETRFTVTDYEASVVIQYTGILPDLFEEGQGVVAEGILSESGVIIASEVLAKHDENYMPPEVAAMLDADSTSRIERPLP